MADIFRTTAGNWDDTNAWTPQGPEVAPSSTVARFGVAASGTTTVFADGDMHNIGGLIVENAAAILVVKGLLDVGFAAAGGAKTFDVTAGKVIVDGGSLFGSGYLASASGAIDVVNGGTYQWNGAKFVVGSGSTQTVNLGSGGNTFQFSTAFNGKITGFNEGETISFSGGQGLVNSISIGTNEVTFDTKKGTFIIKLETAGVTYDNTNVTVSGTSFTTKVTEAQTNPPPVAALVTNVTAATDGFYKAGDVVDITVTFNKAVDAAAGAQLKLETGTTDQFATLLSGSGTSTLTFRYTVQANDASLDLDYFNAGALTGAIKNAGTAVAANLTLPSPGAIGSLGKNKDIVIDTGKPAAPTVSLVQDTGSADGITSNGTLKVSGVEDFATAEYSLDGTNWTSLASLQDLIVDEKAYEVFSRQTDRAGNVSNPKSFEFTLDKSKPAAPIVSLVQDTGSVDGITSNGTLKVSGVEDFATAEYSLDGTNWTSLASLQDLIVDEKAYEIFSRQTDRAGNVSDPQPSFQFTLDKTAPAPLSLTLETDSGVSDTDGVTNVGTLKITQQEKGSKIQYKIDAADWIDGPPAFTNGPYLVQVRQIDLAGNISDPSNTLAFRLDTAPPRPELTFGATTLGFNQSTVVDIKFTEPVPGSPTEKVAGFTLEDLTFLGGSLSGFTKVDDSNYKVTFTPTAGFVGTGSVGVKWDSYTDVAGNNGSGLVFNEEGEGPKGQLKIDATVPPDPDPVPPPGGLLPPGLGTNDIDFATAYRMILRLDPPETFLADKIAAFSGGELTFADYVNQLIDTAKTSTAPALIVANFIEGHTPTDAHLSELAAFAQMQFEAYTAIGVGQAGLGPYEALGRGFSETTAFMQTYGGGTDSAFIDLAYKNVFGRDATSEQTVHFGEQVNYLENLYLKAGIGAVQADLFARGAVLGQMLGVATLSEGPGHPYAPGATAFFIDAADGTVVYNAPLYEVAKSSTFISDFI